MFLSLQSLVQNLTFLTLYGCHTLKELYSVPTIDREDTKENTITFPNLHHLEMHNLKIFKGLCTEGRIEFPALKNVKMRECPELSGILFDSKVRGP